MISVSMSFDRFSLTENDSPQLVSLIALSFEISYESRMVEVMVKDYPDSDNKILVGWAERNQVNDTKVLSLPSRDNLGDQDILAIVDQIGAEDCCDGIGTVSNIRRNTVGIKQNVIETLNKGSLIVSENMLAVDRVHAYVLMADLRNFSGWLLGVDEEDRLTFFQGFADIISYVIQDYHCSYYKLLGDGVLMIWEDDCMGREFGIAEPKRILDVAFCILDLFENIAAAVSRPIENFGIAITHGQLIRFVLPSSQSSLCIKDYIGEPINYAARFQSLAGAGEVLLEQNLRPAMGEAGFTYEVRRVQQSLKGVDKEKTSLFSVVRKP